MTDHIGLAIPALLNVPGGAALRARKQLVGPDPISTFLIALLQMSSFKSTHFHSWLINFSRMLAYRDLTFLRETSLITFFRGGPQAGRRARMAASKSSKMSLRIAAAVLICLLLVLAYVKSRS